MCLYLDIPAVKNTTICQMESLCNMQHYVIYNYVFRLCKWAIIRLFVEPVRWLYNRSFGGGERSRLTSSSPPISYCVVILLVLRTTWWWPTYKTETCSCILNCVAYYTVISSEKLLCFWVHVYISIYILYTVLLT